MMEDVKHSTDQVAGETEEKILHEELEEQCSENGKGETCREQTEAKDALEQENTDKDGFEAKYIRLSADFQNYKRRSEKEKSEIYKSANAKLITELLPLIDDFDRAIAHAEDSGKEAFVDGMEMIIKSFAEILFKEGLEYIETKDAMFDPNLHHAVMMEKAEGVESGRILAEMQKGYKVNGKVIRPSMVKVAE